MLEQQKKINVMTGTGPVPTPLEAPRSTRLTDGSIAVGSRWLTRLFDVEWEAISGLLASLIALVLHLLHLASDADLLQLAVVLIALLFVRVLRREASTNRASTAVHQSLALLKSIEAKLVTTHDLKTHNLCAQIEQIEHSFANPLIKKRWDETRENIYKLAEGRIVVRNRNAIFGYKEEGLKSLGEDEQFRSTVIPKDLDTPAYTHSYFEGYQECMFELAARFRSEGNRVKRLYIFRDEAQFQERRHQEHMQRMADHYVAVRYLILSRDVEDADDRDKIAHADYAIFGRRFYAQFDVGAEYSVIETDRFRIDAAIKHFDSLWRKADNQSIQRREQATEGNAT